MATVPGYGSEGAYRGPRVSTAPLTPSRERPADRSVEFGAAEGRALRNVGQQVSKVGERLGEVTTQLQIEENERQVKKADVALSEGYRLLLDGDGTPENPGYRSLKGEQALEALPTLNKQLTDLRAATEQALPGEKARSMFNTASKIREQQAFGLAAAHSVAQQEVANEAVDIARIQSAVSSAATSYNDPIALATHVAVAESAAKSAAARKSQDPVVLEQAARAARTDAYKAAVISAMRGDDTAEAARLFALHKDKMDGTVAADLARTLSVGAQREQAQAAVDGIMAMGLSEQQALEAVRQNFSGQLEDEINTRVAVQYAAQRRAREEQEKALESEVFGAVNGQGVPLDQWGKGNPEAYALLAQNPTLYDRARRADDARILGQSYARVTDSEVYSRLRGMSDEEMAATDLVPLKQSLTRSDYEELEGRKDAATKSLTATGGDKALYASGRARLNEFAPEDNKGRKVLTSAQMNELRMDMTEWLESERKQGHKIGEPDIARKAQALMLPLFKPSGSKTVGVLGVLDEKTGGRFRLSADGMAMTAEEIQAANNALVRNQKPVSPEAIEQLVGVIRAARAK